MTAIDIIESCGYTVIDSIKSYSPMNDDIAKLLIVVTTLSGVLLFIMLFALYQEYRNSFVKMSSIVLTVVLFVVAIVPMGVWSVNAKEETQYKITETKNPNPSKLLEHFEIVNSKSNNIYTVVREK
ncbi:hypothetical protein OBV_p-00150 (plasmid) [Oscillibacter valericigenes Sjm18-20]|nr:hypothetical protein OBV_p-00150 [Oscillibacter valericigenes Sjm18-20]